jgi:hypothetical protein
MSGTTTARLTLEGEGTLAGNIGAGDELDLTATNDAGLLYSASSSIDNQGTIELTSTASTGSQGVDLRMSSGTLTNDGTIESLAGTAGLGTRGIDGNFTNDSDGAIDVHESLQIGAVAGSTFTTSGTVTVDAGEDLLVGCNASGCQSSTLNIDGGTIADDGSFQQGVAGDGQSGGGGTLHLDGGTVTGNPFLAGGLNVSMSGSGSGSFTLLNVGTLAGTVAAGDNLTLESTASAESFYSAASGLVNDGSIDLTDTNLHSSPLGGTDLILSSGTLTNHGTITADPGSVGIGFLDIDGNLTNASDGTIDVGHELQIDENTPGTFTTSGAITVGAGQAFDVGPASTFDIDGGTIAVDGGIDVGAPNGGGPLNVSGGTITGAGVSASDVALTFQPGNTSTGTFTLDHSTSLTGDVGAGDTLILSSIIPPDVSGTQSTLTSATGFTNNGTIELTDPNPGGSGGYTAALGITSGALRNDGTITSDPGAASQGTRTIAGNVVNDGTLNVNQSLTQNGGMFANSGTVQIGAGDLSVAGAYTQPAGITKLGATNATLTAPGGVTLTGGTLSGDGTVAGALVNAGQVTPAPSPATLSVTGAYTQQAVGFLTADVTTSLPAATTGSR